jgi:hypothetical protein
MKKLQKLVLHKATVMTAPQMKHISGGYDDGGKIYLVCCRYPDKAGCSKTFESPVCSGHGDTCEGAQYTCM